MRIDIYSHILPGKYFKELAKLNPKFENSGEAKCRANVDLDTRLRLMERYPGVFQILTVSNPPLEALVPMKDAAELAKIANDELAEMVDKYPDKFLGAVACVPMNNIEAALKEIDRAAKMGLKGIQITTRIDGQTLDALNFRPVYEKMAKLDLPIWLHPYDNPNLDADGGRLSWPFETAMAMFHIVHGGVFDQFPNLKFITHHCGSMIPMFSRRIGRTDQFKKFYNDTALYGNTDGLMLGYSFFGADHLLFGTDAPLGPKYGYTLQTEKSIERMNIPDEDKEKIFFDNAVNLLRIPL
jgi:predicted TIM-barrel fold metal-dependent hydrolase